MSIVISQSSYTCSVGVALSMFNFFTIFVKRRNVMKVLYLILIIAILISCSNNTKSNNTEINLIVGDCFNDNLINEIDMKMEKLGWKKTDKESNRNLAFLIPEYLLKNEPNVYFKKDLPTNKNKYWFIELNNNKLVIDNSWLNIEKGKVLFTNKQDTAFWNVVNLFRENCELKDSTFLFNFSLIGS